MKKRVYWEITSRSSCTVYRGVSEQSADGEVRDDDVPSEHLRGRVDMFGYFTESVVADIRRRRGVDVDTEFVVRSESELAGE